MKNNPSVTNMSPECKSFIVKKTYEHFQMNIKWREIISKASIACVFIFSILGYEIGDSSVKRQVLIISTLVSALGAWFIDAKKFLIDLHKVEKVYLMDCKDENYDEEFQKILPLIRELDFARGRFDFTQYKKEKNEQIDEPDKFDSHDVNEMNRQRLIICFLCLMGASAMFLLNEIISPNNLLVVVGLLFIAGFIFMIADIFRGRKK